MPHYLSLYIYHNLSPFLIYKNSWGDFENTSEDRKSLTAMGPRLSWNRTTIANWKQTRLKTNMEPKYCWFVDLSFSKRVFFGSMLAFAENWYKRLHMIFFLPRSKVMLCLRTAADRQKMSR